MSETQKPDFESSLKSIETENKLDRIFYRPIGYNIALALRHTGITPNTITIISIFFGVGGGLLFYPTNIWLNLVGILLLICANILDCVDGQLARLTGIKSEVGRILDGFAGDLWFISIYTCITLRISPELGNGWAWTLAAFAGASNLVQSNITDYYKTLHLYFISRKKGAEFDTVERVRAKYAVMPNGINKGFYWLYLYYTIFQTSVTPQLQKLLARLKTAYGNEDIPENTRLALRKMSLKTMPLIDQTTFNGRSIALFIALIINMPYLYLLYEIVVLNIVLFVAIGWHEKNCRKFS